MDRQAHERGEQAYYQHQARQIMEWFNNLPPGNRHLTLNDLKWAMDTKLSPQTAIDEPNLIYELAEELMEKHLSAEDFLKPWKEELERRSVDKKKGE